MNMIFKKLPLGVYFIGIVAIMFLIRSIYKKSVAEDIRLKKAKLQISTTEFINKYQKDSTSIKSHINQYIELEGDLVDIQYSQDTQYIKFTSGEQSDTSYSVRMYLMNPEIPTNACDSLVLSYHKTYKMKSYKPYFVFYAHTYNDDEQIKFKYLPKCKQYISTRKTTNYFLENFCLEKVKIKGKFASIHKENDSTYSVEITPAMLVSQSKNIKKEQL
ncbi:hypothetical protein AD998_17895 [bacterium 336/3]|nr:hypothetical protein AD998_17895 [bacterium 336/3]